MSYKFEVQHKVIPKILDRQRKMFDVDIVEVKELHRKGIAIREIARQFSHKCSRRNIQFILFPERRLKCVDSARNHGWFYTKDRHTKYVREWRQRKQKLNVLGLLE